MAMHVAVACNVELAHLTGSLGVPSGLTLAARAAFYRVMGMR